jgi:hypothetical protein
VVANLSDEPVDDVTLNLASGPLCGSPTAESLDGSTVAREPTITATGGFSGYAPVDHLEPRQGLVIRFGPSP